MSFNNYDSRGSGVFMCRFSFGEKGRQLGVYFAGFLFALGWWAFVDGLLQLAMLENRQVVPGIEDWIPGILTTFGFVIVSLIDKDRLHGDSYGGYEEYVSRARLVLFFGFTLLAGGVAGSVSVLITKYVYHEGGLDILNMYLGIMDVVQTGLILLSTAVLWVVHSHYSENNFRL